MGARRLLSGAHRPAALLLLALLLAAPVRGAALPDPARPDPGGFALEAGFFGRSLALRVGLSRPAPFRVFTLDAPRRLVIDFENLDWAGFDPAARALPAPVAAVRVGPVRPGWARMVVDLAHPLTLASAEMRRAAHGAVLEVRLRRVSPERFAAEAGPPPGDWLPATFPALRGLSGAGPVTVAIDPGHGGIDPGAHHAGIAEKDVVLAFAEALAAELAASGRYRVLLTRREDAFLALSDRVARARAEGAAAFISLHANAAADPSVQGAIVFTRAAAASSRAAAARAALENRADAGAGFAAPAESALAAALADLAGARTGPRAGALAEAIAASLEGLPGNLNRHPEQAADFEVLRAPDMPSVLLELGFLSNPQDRARMLDPAWRAEAAAAIRRALDGWITE